MTEINRILLITSSPRKKSNSTFIAQHIAEGIKGKIEKVNICDYKINPCTGCDNCRKNFKCVINDDVKDIIKKVEMANIIIVASPIYFTGVPAQLKAFIDRNQVQWYKNRKKIKKIKKGIIVLTADLKGKKNFIAAESEIRSFFAVNRIKCVKVLKFSGEDIKNFKKRSEKWRLII
jgi:multimeric flavodoxin WrbA